MKKKTLTAGILIALMCVMTSTGCTRSFRDGVSIGITDGLSDGIAGLLNNFISSLGGN